MKHYMDKETAYIYWWTFLADIYFYEGWIFEIEFIFIVRMYICVYISLLKRSNNN